MDGVRGGGGVLRQRGDAFIGNSVSALTNDGLGSSCIIESNMQLSHFILSLLDH